MEFKALGKPTRQPTDELETFPAPPRVQTVSFTTQELASLCPVTGQPDLSTARIVYAPAGACIESKSLKLYLWTFRNRGIFAEDLAQEIADRVAQVAHPHWCEVTITQQVRGGIQTEVVARVEG